MIIHTIDSYRILSFHVKVRHSQHYKFKKKINHGILHKKNDYASHLLKMLNKKYKMDSASIVEATERTQFRPRTADGLTDRRMDGQAGGRARWNRYIPISALLKRGTKEVYITIKILVGSDTKVKHGIYTVIHTRQKTCLINSFVNLWLHQRLNKK